MNKKRQLLIILILAISGIYGNIYAQQSVYVKETNGDLTQVPLTQVQKITFSGTDMVLHKTDASTIIWATVDVHKYYYALSTNVESSETQERNDILIYPNPSNGSFKINYQVKYNGIVNISILSIDGKLIKSLLSEQKKQGYYSLNISENLKQGSYFIKIANQNNLVTKKIIIIK